MISPRAAFPKQIQPVQSPRTLTERRILDALFRRGAMTQSALAAEIGVTQQSISRSVSKMATAGLLQSNDQAPSGKHGYPTHVAALMPRYTLSCGIVLESEAVSLAVVDFTGRVRLDYKSRFGAQGARATVLKHVLRWAAAVLDMMKQADVAERIAGVGIGVRGAHSGDGTTFHMPRDLEAWAGIDIAALFAGHLGIPCWADTAANVAALGESMAGVGRWARSFAYIDVGADVGGGLVLDGALWRGRHGNAGAFMGGLPPNLYPSPDLDLLRRIIAKNGHPCATVKELLETWDDSWPGLEASMDEWIARVRGALSIIASTAAAMLDVDAVVLGGRMPKSLAQRLMPHLELYGPNAGTRGATKIVPAETPGNVAAIGAALMPLKHTLFAV